MQTIHLKLHGLNCAACIARTEKALLAVPGVASVQVEVHAATVRYHGALVPHHLLEAVAKAGYRAEVPPGE